MRCKNVFSNFFLLFLIGSLAGKSVYVFVQEKVEL